ncbi:MAG: hypothetical protein Q8O99_07600 [bacterium]|nr:hypothetical protein [bacterium]
MDTDINRSKQQLENLITHTQLVTIATSPYFLDQQRALELLKFLFT